MDKNACDYSLLMHNGAGCIGKHKGGVLVGGFRQLTDDECMGFVHDYLLRKLICGQGRMTISCGAGEPSIEIKLV